MHRLHLPHASLSHVLLDAPGLENDNHIYSNGIGEDGEKVYHGSKIQDQDICQVEYGGTLYDGLDHLFSGKCHRIYHTY